MTLKKHFYVISKCHIHAGTGRHVLCSSTHIKVNYAQRPCHHSISRSTQRTDLGSYTEEMELLLMTVMTVLLTDFAHSRTHSCRTQTLMVNLDEVPAAPTSYRNVTYSPSSTSLRLVCTGENVRNLSWQTRDALGKRISSYNTEGRSYLAMTLPCEELSLCSQITLTCSGERIADNTKQQLFIDVFPECTSQPNFNKQESSTNTTELLTLSPMPYFGIILGFSICVGLAFISCMVVFLQKQLSTKSFARYCGGRMYSHQQSAVEKHQQEMENQRRNNQMIEPMPIMRFTKLGKSCTGHAQANQKMNTLYEV